MILGEWEEQEPFDAHEAKLGDLFQPGHDFQKVLLHDQQYDSQAAHEQNAYKFEDDLHGAREPLVANIVLRAFWQVRCRLLKASVSSFYAPVASRPYPSRLMDLDRQHNPCFKTVIAIQINIHSIKIRSILKPPILDCDIYRGNSTNQDKL